MTPSGAHDLLCLPPDPVRALAANGTSDAGCRYAITLCPRDGHRAHGALIVKAPREGPLRGGHCSRLIIEVRGRAAEFMSSRRDRCGV